MMTDYTQNRDDLRRALRSLNTAIPDATRAFGALGKSVKAEGALDVKTKELVAVAIAVSDRCEPCIIFHIDALICAGGTREELAETLGMCVYMGGGPSLMYAAKALACFEEFSGPMAV